MTEGQTTANQPQDDQEERAVLTVEHLVKQYPRAQSPVLNDISFQVPKGKVFVVLGPSGSGKSTLLRTIAGLEPIQGGRILLDGQVVETGHPLGKRSGGPGGLMSGSRSSDLRTRIGMVFQSYDLFPNRTVLDNVTLAPVLVQKRKRDQARQEALELLDRVGLADRRDAWPSQLSGGEQQRVCVARALINEPKLILADEPTGNLDEANERIVLDLFRQLHDQGTSLIVVTHDALVASCAQREIMLNHGVLAGEQWNDEEARRAYLAAGGRPAFSGAPGDSGDQDIPVGFHDPTKIAKTGGSLSGSAAESEGGR
ncbi:MAG: ATP-binding cassette domain-containing protein [Bifidobacterium sp.]|nr:ATP-binding cassette domain-containing protein [Bifidobacterium sp.]